MQPSAKVHLIDTHIHSLGFLSKTDHPLIHPAGNPHGPRTAAKIPRGSGFHSRFHAGREKIGACYVKHPRVTSGQWRFVLHPLFSINTVGWNLGMWRDAGKQRCSKNV